MTDHEQAVKLINSLELSERQVADVLGISVPGVRLKKQNKRYNKFTESNLNKLKEYLEQKKYLLDYYLQQEYEFKQELYETHKPGL